MCKVGGTTPSAQGQAAVAKGGAEPAAAGLLSLVPPPDRPKGPSAGTVGEKLKYTTKGTDPLNVHKYQYDWGDGNVGKWRSEKQSHKCTQPGTFSIKVREKCPLELFVTDWSKPRAVTISESAPVATKAQPAGAARRLGERGVRSGTGRARK
jgi:hypothetical protein